MAVDNKPSTNVFYSEMGVSIRETKRKLRAGVNAVAVRWFVIVRRKRAVDTRAPDAAQRVALAKRCAAEPGP
jgi:hypothetical protein